MECVIVTNRGRLVAIDQNSGGYPWLTDRLGAARIWQDPKYAEGYMKTMHRRADEEGWRICRVKVEF